MRRLLVALAVAAAISSCGSGPKPALLDVQAARACETYFEFYRGPPRPISESVMQLMPREARKGIENNDKRSRKIHTPTAQEVRDAVRPLMPSFKWSELGAKLAWAADAGSAGSAPPNDASSAAFHECNSIPPAAKKAGGWAVTALGD